jgi:mRNA interferase MazF
MEQYRPGEVVLLAFPFTGNEETKRRPALVLLDTGDADVVVARITSQDPISPFDVVVGAWQQAGLLLLSTVRVRKLATLEKSRAKRRLGALAPDDWQRVQTAFRQTWIGRLP